MLPDLTFLLAVLLGLGAFGPAPHSPLTAFAGTAALTAIAVALVRMSAERARRALQEEGPEQALLRLPWLVLAPLLAWSVSLQTLRYGAAVHAALPQATWLLRYVVLFLPLLVSFAAAWAARGEIEGAVARSLGRPAAHATPWAAVRAGLRKNGLALIPMGLLIGLVEGLAIAADLGVPGCGAALNAVQDVPQLEVLVVLLVLLGLSLLLPRVLTRLLHSEPFPEGPLRRRLEALATALRLTYRDMRLWKTGGRGLNAMVVGLTRGTRRIFVTDGLLAALPPEEVEAVFCHEAAHAKRGHLAWFLGLTGLLSLLFMLLDEPLAWLGIDGLPRSLLYLALLWFGLLGFVSRQFERESDVDGGQNAALLDPEVAPHQVPGLAAPLPEGALRMVRALKRLEGLVGNAYSHRHGTLADRAAYVALHATDEGTRREFTRRARGLRWAFVLTGAALVAATLLRLPGDLARARAHGELRDAQVSYEAAFADVERAPSRAAGAWRQAVEAFRRAALGLAEHTTERARREQVLAWLGLGDAALRGTGDLAQAREGYERALAQATPANLGPEGARLVAFTAQVDLARVLLRLGSPLETLRGMYAQAERRLPNAEGRRGAYLRARLRLLASALDRHGPERERAERMLADLARSPGSEAEWIELRRDAAADLALPVR